MHNTHKVVPVVEHHYIYKTRSISTLITSIFVLLVVHIMYYAISVYYRVEQTITLMRMVETAVHIVEGMQ